MRCPKTNVSKTITRYISLAHIGVADLIGQMASFIIDLLISDLRNALESGYVDLPSLEGEAHGENGAEQHGEPNDEGEDDGVFTLHIQRRCEICNGTTLTKSVNLLFWHIFPAESGNLLYTKYST